MLSTSGHRSVGPERACVPRHFVERGSRFFHLIGREASCRTPAPLCRDRFALMPRQSGRLARATAPSGTRRPPRMLEQRLGLAGCRLAVADRVRQVLRVLLQDVDVLDGCFACGPGRSGGVAFERRLQFILEVIRVLCGRVSRGAHFAVVHATRQLAFQGGNRNPIGGGQIVQTGRQPVPFAGSA